MKRRATAVWQGDGLTGKGSLSTPSKVFDNTPYNFTARFKNEDGKNGTNPEELIAAAHAGCFNMALSFGLVGAGYVAERLETKAVVTIEQDEGSQDFSITSIVLKMNAIVPEISEEKFTELANGAKAGCPISKALSTVPMTLEIDFSNS
ncbi:MAG: OsmC family protein [Bacteroidota bacterium]